MNLENELLEKFQVEELEKRFEMGWIPTVTRDENGTHFNFSDDEPPPPPPGTEPEVDPEFIHFLTPAEKAALEAAKKAAQQAGG